MSRFTLALALLLALFSYTASETIVTDSVGNGVFLPTTGGNAMNYITVLNSQASTSPYYLYISLNNGAADSPNSATAGEVETFYFNTTGAGQMNTSNIAFGNATLINQYYSSTFQHGGTPGNYVRNSSNPDTATGMYTFVFTIPALSTLMVNLTYINSHDNPLPITEFIQIVIFNPLTITGDPQFVGLRGQSYQVHGIDGAVYNIISEQNTQVNSRFVFLNEGKCPIVNGKAGSNCWSHPGSYLGEISYQAIVDGKLHAALVQSGPAQKGFAGVQVDGRSVQVGDKVSFGPFSLERTSTHGVSVTTENFSFELSNSDMFINQAIRPLVPLSELTATHGLLGQTHSTKTYGSAIKYIMGDVDDYVIADSDIFGHDFVYNQFNL